MSAVVTRKRSRSQSAEKTLERREAAPVPRLETSIEEEEKSAIRQLVTSVLQDWRGAQKLLNEDIIRTVLRRVRPVLMSQPMMVRLEAPVNVCGDIHGQINDLVEIFRAGGMPPASRYLF
ncbi:serine/threonine-protein phosphatase PP1, partial [Trypanosoma cruzi]